MRILHILASNAYSGAEKVVISTIKNYPNNVHGIYCSPNGIIEEKLTEEKIPYILLSRLSMIGLYRVIKEVDPDIIQAHDFKASVLVSIVAKKYPVISHIHHNPTWIATPGLKTSIFNWSMPNFDRVFTVSEAIINEFSIENKDKFINVKNPIDFSEIDKLSQNCVDENIDILFVGRLVEAKDPKKLMYFFERMLTKNPTLRIGVVGNGEYLDYMQKETLKIGATANIKFYGYQSNPYCFFSNATLSVLTSKWEGFGLVAAESLYLETPMLSLRTGGVVEVLEPVNFLLAEDIDEMVDKAFMLLENREYRDFLSKIGKTSVLERYDMEKYIDNLMGMYEQIIIERGRKNQ